jgi:hypothetical protein
LRERDRVRGALRHKFSPHPNLLPQGEKEKNDNPFPPRDYQKNLLRIYVLSAY